MITVRQIWGPFHPSTERLGSNVVMRWYFHGIRADHSMARWVLKYETGKGKFSASARPFSTSKIPDPNQQDMFLKKPGGQIETGKVVDLLRKRLSPRDKAMVARAKITGSV